MFIQPFPAQAPPPPAILVYDEAAVQHQLEPEPEPVEIIIHELPAPPPPPPPAIRVDLDQEKLDWAVKMVGFCLSPVVAIALQSSQTNQSHETPWALYSLSLALVFSFSFLFLSKFLDLESPKITKLLERIGVFLAVMAIFIAIAIAVPPLKFFTWTVCVACLAMVFWQNLATRAV